MYGTATTPSTSIVLLRGISCGLWSSILRCRSASLDVCICLPRNFTTEYESVILRGEAHIHLSAEEMMRALHLLVDKLSPDFKEIGYKYSEKSFHRVDIIRVDFTGFSGKCKHVAKAD